MRSTRQDNQRTMQRTQDEENAAPALIAGPPWGLLMTGLVVVGLGVMAWQYLGPDFKRYMKMTNM